MSSPYDLSGGAMSQAQSDAMMAAYQRQADANAKEIANKYKLGKDDIAARLKIAAQTSKDNRYGIDAVRDTAREQIAQAQAEMERIGIPDMEIRRFVAESTKALAEAELSLKRDQFLVDTRQKDAQLQLDREQMERVGIPQMEINRYIAEKSAEMDRLTYGEDQRQFNITTAEDQRQYNTTASGYLQQGGQLTAQQQARLGQIQARDSQLKAAGQPGIGAESPESEQEMYQLLDMQAGRVANPATGTGGPGGGTGGLQATLDREKFFQDQMEQNRRYGFDVAKFGADLAATPDTYFQARRFQGVDVPRLMGGAGAQTSAPTGGPTPGVATMGSYLSGQDPYATPYGGPAAGAQQPAAPGSLGTPGTPEDDRYKQVQQIAKTVPPSPYDGLNEQDTSALKLMESIYKRGGNQIAGGEYERLQASGRLGYLQSAGRLLGYSPSDLENEYKSYRPTQGSASLAG